MLRSTQAGFSPECFDASPLPMMPTTEKAKVRHRSSFSREDASRTETLDTNYNEKTSYLPRLKLCCVTSVRAEQRQY